MKFTVYTQDANKKGEVELSDDIFGAPFKPALIRQVVLAFLANARTPVAHTKDRGEVSGGGRKPWRQKGTGRARHGSIRSPIWVGGGVAHGPRKEKDYSQKVNKKMRRIAMISALSRKAKDGEIIVIDSLNFDEPKTKKAKEILMSFSKLDGFEKLAYKKRNLAVFVLPEKDLNVWKSFANFGNIYAKTATDLNAWDLMKYKFVFIVDPEKVEEKIKERISK